MGAVYQARVQESQLCHAADWTLIQISQPPKVQARSLSPVKIEGDFSVRPVRQSDSLVHLLREYLQIRYAMTVEEEH